MIWICDCNHWIKAEGNIPMVVTCPVCSRQWNLNPLTIPTTHCWSYGCDRNTIYRLGQNDGVYGHFCFECKQSLRTHPFFGEGKEFDKGDFQKWNRWLMLTESDRHMIYVKYGFRAERRSLAYG